MKCIFTAMTAIFATLYACQPSGTLDVDTPPLSLELVGEDWGQPAEAEDLDPDPDVLHAKFVVADHVHTVDGLPFDGYAYNGQTPGPTLRAKLGDTLIVEVENLLDQETTIHWHGMHVPFEMDGVPYTIDPIGPGESFTYTFTLNQTGTYWYHPHINTEGQLDRGLYGMVIIEDDEEPTADEELVLVFDGWDELADHDHPDGWSLIHEHGADAIIERWRVNGQVSSTLEVEGGQVVRARILNASNGGYLALDGPGMRQIASDQGFLSAPREEMPLLLASGDRVEVEILVGEDDVVLQALPYTLNGGSTWGEVQDVLTLKVNAPAPAPEPIQWPFSMAVPTSDPGHTDIYYVFSGSAREGTWLINGQTWSGGVDDEVPLGAELMIELRNLSPTEHPFHMHGHQFEVISVDGIAPEHRVMEDTINVAIRQTVRLKMIAENPGYWMIHCHILSHAHKGMMTLLHVLDD